MPARSSAAGDDPAAPSAAFVVLASGSGTRVGATVGGRAVNKVYLPLAGRSVVTWSFAWASEIASITTFVLVVRPQDVELAARTLQRELPDLRIEVVPGGATRHDSEQAALAHLRPRVATGEIGIIAVHDGARPLAEPALITSVLAAAAEAGGALPAIPATGVSGRVGSVGSVGSAGSAGSGGQNSRARLVRVQTPQAFRAAPLLAAYAAARAAGVPGTDTASTVEAFSALAVRVVPGSRRNLKVTFAHDLIVAERLLRPHGRSAAPHHPS